MPNALLHEQSPYLQQHAHNPVDWYPWGDEAFEKAKAENKPVLVSIGYAACHWCHVMERESFENHDTAAFMNAHFINIKVDREEHPDVDHMYMDAVQGISGGGGWPLNVFVTPERVPFYGGTYYPPREGYGRPSWMQLLAHMSEIWTQQPEEVATQTNQMLQYLRQTAQVPLTDATKEWDMGTCATIAVTLLQQADAADGGFGGAPKFPGSMAISFLLEHDHFMQNETGRKHALLSLDKMTAGGIYDQLGGGFARYATDKKWLVPHFEKMLYDNALLVLSLCDAYSLTKDKKYRQTIEETIAFVARELRAPGGLYYSALDADSEGVEGKFYTFTWKEWVAVAGADDAVGMAYFGISEEGNWEETNILHEAMSVEDVAAQTGQSADAVTQHITQLKEKLLAARAPRVRPQTDDKSLLSWNALMNLALTRAGVVLQNADYLQTAATHAQLMLDSYTGEDGTLLHTWKAGTARIAAKLDDYAYLIQALLQCASATGNTPMIQEAAKLMEQVQEAFAQEGSPFFYYSAATQTDIPVRKVDTYDGAQPSANAYMTHNLLLLGPLLERTDWMEQGYNMLAQMQPTVLRYPSSFGYWALLLQRYAAGLQTAVVAGPQADALHAELLQTYAPQAYMPVAGENVDNIPLLQGKARMSETFIFVCTGLECLPPVSNVADARKLLRAGA